MKDALNDFLKPKEETASATPGLGEDFSLAGMEDEEGEGGLLGEIQSKLSSATPEQLQQIKSILGESEDSESEMPPPPGGGDMGMPM